MSSSGYVGFTLRFTATIIIPKPGCLRHRSSHVGCRFGRREVVGLSAVFSVFVGPVMYLCQGFVAVGIGVYIGISVVWVDFLQEVAAIPNEFGFLFEAV